VKEDSLGSLVTIGASVVGLLVVLAVVWGLVHRGNAANAGPALGVVNASGESLLSIWVDGQRALANVPRVSEESPRDARMVALPPGPHQVEARSASGAVVESANFVADEITSFVFAPRHGANLCFALVSSRGPMGVGEIWQPLTQDLWSIKGHVTHWFEPLPSSGSRATDLAVRMYPCSQRVP
jgi:hypothetical protein